MQNKNIKRKKEKLQKKIIKEIKSHSNMGLMDIIYDLKSSSDDDLSLDIFNASPSINHIFSPNEKFPIINKMVEASLLGALRVLLEQNFYLSSLNFNFNHRLYNNDSSALSFYIKICINTLANSKHNQILSFIMNTQKRENMEVEFYSLMCSYLRSIDDNPDIFSLELEQDLFSFLTVYSSFFEDSPLIGLITKKINPNKPKHFDLIKNNKSILLNKLVQKDPKHFKYLCELILSREISHNIFLTDYVNEDSTYKFKNSSLNILNKLLPTSAKNSVKERFKSSSLDVLNKLLPTSGKNTIKEKTVIMNEPISSTSLSRNIMTEEQFQRLDNTPYYQIYFTASGEMIVDFKGTLMKINLKSSPCSFKEESDCFVFNVNSETFNLYKNNFKDYEAIKKFHLKVKDFFNPKSSLKIKIL